MTNGFLSLIGCAEVLSDLVKCACVRACMCVCVRACVWQVLSIASVHTSILCAKVAFE